MCFSTAVDGSGHLQALLFSLDQIGVWVKGQELWANIFWGVFLLKFLIPNDLFNCATCWGRFLLVASFPFQRWTLAPNCPVPPHHLHPLSPEKWPLLDVTPSGVSSGSYASRLTKIKGVTFKGVIDTSFPAPQIANVPLSYHWLVRLWVQQPTPTHSTKWSSSLSRVTWLTKWWENIQWQKIVTLFCQPSCSLPSFYNRFLLF